MGDSMSEHYLSVPLSEEEVRGLQLGDMVYFSGPTWTCRSRLQRYVFDEGHRLPFSAEGRNLLIHVGPVAIQKEGSWRLVSFIPTSSIRFEKWGPRSIREWGVTASVGTTTMGRATAQAMKKYGCIHATPIGVTPNLFLERIEIKEVFWLEELGSIEAAWHLELNDLGPFLVDMDCNGNNYFDELHGLVEARRKEAYRYLSIPEDFEYTKLY
jgi:L(+)-tartrate dehydratase beta subunit